MITCHVCQTSIYYGTLFCPQCCARVSEDSSSPTNALPAGKADEITPPPAPQDQSRVPLRASDSISLRIAGNNVGIPLFGQQEYILGRAEKGQAVIPDIDLPVRGARQGRIPPALPSALRRRGPPGGGSGQRQWHVHQRSPGASRPSHDHCGRGCAPAGKSEN
jgi:hypothetical protein